MFLPDLSDISFQERYSNKGLHVAALVPGLRYHLFLSVIQTLKKSSVGTETASANVTFVPLIILCV